MAWRTSLKLHKLFVAEVRVNGGSRSPINKVVLTF